MSEITSYLLNLKPSDPPLRSVSHIRNMYNECMNADEAEPRALYLNTYGKDSHGYNILNTSISNSS